MRARPEFLAALIAIAKSEAEASRLEGLALDFRERAGLQRRKLDADVRIALKVDPTELETCLPPVAEVVTSHGWAQPEHRDDIEARVAKFRGQLAGATGAIPTFWFRKGVQPSPDHCSSCGDPLGGKAWGRCKACGVAVRWVLAEAER